MPASTLPPRPTEITNITETLELRGTWARRALRWFYAPIPPHPRERYRLHIIASNYDILASTLNLIQSRRDVAVIRPVASPILIDHAIAVTKQEIVSRFTVKLVFVTAADDNVISPLPIDVVLTVSPIDPENISVCIYAAVVTGASPRSSATCSPKIRSLPPLPKTVSPPSPAAMVSSPPLPLMVSALPVPKHVPPVQFTVAAPATPVVTPTATPRMKGKLTRTAAARMFT